MKRYSIVVEGCECGAEAIFNITECDNGGWVDADEAAQILARAEAAEKMLAEAVEWLSAMNSEYKWFPVTGWLEDYRAAAGGGEGE